MKLMKIFIKSLCALLLCFCITVFGMLFYLNQTVSSNYKVHAGENFVFKSKIPVTAVYNTVAQSGNSLTKQIGSNFNVDLKMFGIFPVSTVEVEIVDDMYVAVMGNLFGIRIYTDGVMIIAITDVDGSSGTVSPARSSGLVKGDVIVSIDGVNVYSNEQVSNIIEKSNGSKMEFTVLRENKKMTVYLTPVKSVETGLYRAGLWVRDSSAGIGTLTFYSPSTGIICGLGHGICDSDTGVLLPLNSGQLVGAKLISLEKGRVGAPGELKGRFTSDIIASLDKNCHMGVYGSLLCDIKLSDLTRIALKQEIIDGPAQILCTVDDSGPTAYSCTVKRKINANNSDTQNLIVSVTDERLLQKTGGIIQGMSGSPILQNGKLIGSVTHVLIDDPTTGYGIFAENMLESAQSVAEEQKFKEAG